jgi:hypothetical protein
VTTRVAVVLTVRMVPTGLSGRRAHPTPPGLARTLRVRIQPVWMEQNRALYVFHHLQYVGRERVVEVVNINLRVTKIGKSTLCQDSHL